MFINHIMGEMMRQKVQEILEVWWTQAQACNEHWHHANGMIDKNRQALTW